MSGTKGVDAVDRALTVLDCFDAEAQRLTLAELAARTGLHKSTILRLAASLERFGHLSRGLDGRFRLGPATWRLGSTYRQGHALAEIVRPALADLSRETCETASYYVRDGERRVCLFRSVPSRGILHAVVEGASLPLDRGAGGRVLRAWSEPETPGAEALRAAGHALSRGERDPEVAGLAVPVLASDGRVLGALGVSGLVTRFDDARVPGLLAALRAVRDRLAPHLAA